MMMQVILAHGGSGPAMLAPLFFPVAFGAMLVYFVKKNPRQSDPRQRNSKF